MSISSSQTEREQGRIIQSLLKEGIEPNSFEVSTRLSEFFDRNVPGLPYFAPVKQASHATSNPSAYNRMFQDLSEDLSVAYQSDVQANNSLVSIEEHYIEEAGRVMAEIKNLELRLENLNDTLVSGSAGEGHTQVFRDFYDIDFDGDEQRNIPATTAFVDLLRKKVHTETDLRANRKKDLSRAGLSIRPSKAPMTTEEYGEAHNILKDNLGESYTYIGRTKEKEGMTLVLQVTETKASEVSGISLRLASYQDVKAVLSVSEDGINYTDLYEVSSQPYLEWNFSATPIKDFRITLTKSEPDGYTADGLYEHYFSFQTLSVLNESYGKESVYVSKPITFGTLLGSLTLKAEDLVFPGTRINYYIGIDNGKDKVSWESVGNYESHDLRILRKKRRIVNSLSEGYAEKPQGELQLYRVTKVPDNINLNSLKLTPGYQMWHVDTYDIADTSLANAFQIDQLIFDDVVKAAVGARKGESYLDCDKYQFPIAEKSLHVLTQYVDAGEEVGTLNKSLSMEGVTLQHRLFVNGAELRSIGDKYAIRLKKGVNKIQLLLYAETSGVVTHNLNFKENSLDTFAVPPMSQVNYYTLKHRTPAGNYRYFAVKDGYLVVAHNPRLVTSDEDGAAEAMGYYLTYQELKPDYVDLVLELTRGKAVQFRLMALLMSEDAAVSPQILNYRIIGQ